MAGNGGDRGLVDGTHPALTLEDLVYGAASLAREAWEPIWPVWRRLVGCPEGPAPSFEACVPSAFALEVALRQIVPELRWKAVGGRPTSRTPTAGCRAPAGTWHPHLWVEGRRRGAPRVAVDVTADQFGCPPVVVAHNAIGYRANATGSILARYRQSEHATVSLLLEALNAHIELQRRG